MRRITSSRRRDISDSGISFSEWAFDMRAPFKGRSPVTRFPEHAHALGMIIVEMGALEAASVHLQAAILRTTERVADALLMSSASTRARIDIIQNAADCLLLPEDAAKVKRLTKKSDKLLNKRNTLVHGVWGSNGESVSLIPIPKGNIREIHLNELNDIIELTRSCSDEIIYLCHALEHRPHYDVNISYNICM